MIEIFWRISLNWILLEDNTILKWEIVMESNILKLKPFFVKRFGDMNNGFYQLIKKDILKLKIMKLT